MTLSHKEAIQLNNISAPGVCPMIHDLSCMSKPRLPEARRPSAARKPT